MLTLKEALKLVKGANIAICDHESKKFIYKEYFEPSYVLNNADPALLTKQVKHIGTVQGHYIKFYI